MPGAPRIAVVGGGISGLCGAVNALEASPGAEITLFESSPRAGGNLRTEEIDGYRIEWAANGFLPNAPETLDLAQRLGLGARLCPADPAAARRYILRRGRLHLVPVSPPAFLSSSLLSAAGRLRALGEPMVPARAASEGSDETVHDFAARRLGREVAEVLVGSFVSGIFAGDARQLSVESAFPALPEMERRHGGLLRGMIARRKAAGAKSGGPAPDRAAPMGGRLTSFTGGMEELVSALARSLGNRVRTGVGPVAIGRARDGRAFALRFAAGEPFEADRLLLACPARAAARLVAGIDPALGELLGGIPTAPVVVAALGYRLPSPASAPDGFGFLVARGESVRALGALFDSNIFPGRAPAGRLLVRVLFGGVHDPGAIDRDDAAILGEAREALASGAGFRLEPELARVVRHPGGIPQYVVGHAARLRAIEARLAGHPGLFLSGNSYRGVSMNACVAEASTVAARLIAEPAGSAAPAPAPARA